MDVIYCNILFYACSNRAGFCLVCIKNIGKFCTLDTSYFMHIVDLPLRRMPLTTSKKMV